MLIGIDLGTTNSAVAVWQDGAPRLLPNALGHVLTPSAVSIDSSGTVLVGLAARERQVTHPGDSATAFKRHMGTTRATWLSGRSFLPEELSALVLASLKRDAEAALGEPVTGAIITVPAYFTDKQRKATRRAGELAGLKVERLINEPTAAALAYGIHRLQEEPKFLVFDLGGGTFDVSVLEMFDGVIEVRASTGDNFLGGEDFNELLIERFFREHREQLREKRPASNPLLYFRVREAAERARRALSSSPAARMEVVWRDAQHTLEISADEFEKLAEVLVERLREPVRRALRDARIAGASLTEIVLVGGATRMPIVRQAVTRLFGRFPATHLNPDEAVALGAGVQAGLRARDVDLREVVLTDVCPYSLGVDTGEKMPDGSIRSGLFTPIIERNTIVPASRIRRFFNLADGQADVKFGVYQGEARFVSDNILLGTVRVPIPPGPAGTIAVDCRFTYDINGLLEVDVLVPGTGERRELVIHDSDSSVKPEELAARRQALAALKVHPRDMDANRAVLARLQRCYEEALGADREQIGHVIVQFEAVLEHQDPREIEQARAKVTELLDRRDGGNYL